MPTVITPTATIPQGNTLEFVENSVLAFPNPFDGYQDLRIRFLITRSSDKVEFRLYTASNRLIRRVEMDKSEVASGLTNGIMNEIVIKKAEFKIGRAHV